MRSVHSDLRSASLEGKSEEGKTRDQRTEIRSQRSRSVKDRGRRSEVSQGSIRLRVILRRDKWEAAGLIEKESSTLRESHRGGFRNCQS